MFSKTIKHHSLLLRTNTAQFNYFFNDGDLLRVDCFEELLPGLSRASGETAREDFAGLLGGDVSILM
jgi:hypothetical protein